MKTNQNWEKFEIMTYVTIKNGKIINAKSLKPQKKNQIRSFGTQHESESSWKNALNGWKPRSKLFSLGHVW